MWNAKYPREESVACCLSALRRISAGVASISHCGTNGECDMRRFLVAIPVAALAIGGSTACATKKFVRTRVAEVNQKVDSVGQSVEETQERTRKNENRIGEVDQKAQAAQQSAQQADQAARQASQTATQASSVAKTADLKADALDRASKRLVNEVVLTEDEDHFAFDQTALPDSAKKKLDELVTHLNQDPKNVFIEIEGFTDNVGPKQINEKVGLERAEAAERYLHEHYQIPLHRMNVISYGEEQPVAPNRTRAGRAQNRRIVIRVLA
jgi:peptidoglycan-associated lipoprotein